MKEIISYRNIKKRALFKMLKESLKNLSLLRIGNFNRKGTVLAANLDELITRDLSRSPLPPPPPGAGDEHFQNKYERIVSRNALT
jgi:hypothetical protein